MSTKRITDPIASKAIKLAAKDATKQRPQEPASNQREQLRHALSLEGLTLQPDGSVKGKSDQ